MTMRRALLAILRWIGTSVGTFAVFCALCYVILTSPPGMRWLARTVSLKMETDFGLHLKVGSLDSDLFSYLLLRHTSLVLPGSGTEITVNRLHVRFALWRLLKAELSGIQRLSVDNLVVVVPLAEESEPVAWSIEPALPYVPNDADIRGVTVVLAGKTDSTSLSLRTAALHCRPSALDSSLYATLELSGDVTLTGFGEIPFAGRGHLYLKGPLLRAAGMEIRGPGVEAKGYVELTDVINGPYRTDGTLEVELSQLPRRASGLDVSGALSLEGTFQLDERPFAHVTLRSPEVNTPWAEVSDILFHLDTSDSLVFVKGGFALAGGRLVTDASMPLPPLSGPANVAVNLAGINLRTAADMPILRDALAGTPLSGVLDARWFCRGRVHGGWPGTKVEARSSDLSVRAESLEVANVPVGALVASWSQVGSQTAGGLALLGANVAVTGHSYSSDDVDLSLAVSVPSLDTLLSAFRITGLRAGVDANARVSGPLLAPDVQVQALVSRVAAADTPFPDFTLATQMKRADTLALAVASADERFRMNAVIQDSFRTLDSLTIIVTRWPISGIPGGADTAYGVAGAISAEVVGSGPLSSPRLSAQVETTPIIWNDQDVGSIAGWATWADKVASFRMRNSEGSLTFEGTVASDSGAQSSVFCAWQEFDLGNILAALTRQDVSRVAGISHGSITARWRRKVLDSFTIGARVDDVEVRLGNVTYRLVNPPAYFEMTEGRLSLPAVRLVGDRQVLDVSGSITRAGDMDFRLLFDNVDIGNLVEFATGGGVEMAGTLRANVRLAGVVGQPIAQGEVTAQGVRWRAVEVDSFGFRATLAHDTLSVPDIHVKFPFGHAQGSFRATTASVGLPVSGAVEPEFAGRLRLWDAGISVRNWEGLRGGTITGTGSMDIRGREIGDILSYSGILMLDSLSVNAPFNRKISLVEPTVIEIENGRRPLRKPFRLQLHNRDGFAGELIVSHPADTIRARTDLSISHLSFEDLRHVALPLLKALGVTSVPSDLSGTLSADAAWNMDVASPVASLNLRVIEPSAMGIAGDSLRAAAVYRANVLTIGRAEFFSGADTLRVVGALNPSADTVRVQVRTNEIELVEVLEDLLPPLRRHEPPPPWPTTMPAPGYGQQIGYVPADARGAHFAAPLSTFERLARNRRSPILHPYAAMLPLEADLLVTGRLSDPEINGEARVLGGYLELEAVKEPIWWPDTVAIRFVGRKIHVPPPVRVYVGSEGITERTPPSIDLTRLAYSLSTAGFDVRARLNRATFSVESRTPVFVPPKLRFARFILEPLLTSYYSDPVGVFTADADLRWRGTPERSRLSGEVRLHSSTYSYPVAQPAALLRPPAPTSLGPMLDNMELALDVSTEDSLIISNNLSKRATAWIQLSVSGRHHDPGLQGRVEVSPGSVFRYLGQEFVVEQATVEFRDPTRFEPALDLRARAVVGDPFNDDKNVPYYEVTITISGVMPSLVRTEMVAEEKFPGQSSGEIIVSQLEIMQILIYGRRTSDYLSFDTQGRLNEYLRNRGYATISSALGTVIPVDRVTVQEQDQTATGDQAAAGSDVEVEVAQTFRVLGQRLTVTAATPVGQISNITNLQRADVRWYILNRPQFWQNLESLSLTVGQNRLKRQAIESLQLNETETTAGLQLHIRFR